MKYTLDISGVKTIENPTSADIEKAMEGLDTKKGDAYLILGVNEMTYIQSSGDVKIGFDLEYQEGSLQKHFRAKDDNLKKEIIISILVKYLNADPSWKSAVLWEPIKS